MQKRIAVFDETGTNNRPQSDDLSGFGVGAIIFPFDHVQSLSLASKNIGSLVKNGDFKYKDVKNCEPARELFIRTINSTDPPVNLYAFYAHGACMTHEITRTKKAAAIYGREYGKESSPRGKGFTTFDSFITYMASCIVAHAASNNYAIDIYWDRRTDLEQIKASFDKNVELQSVTRRYRDVAKKVNFCGAVTQELYPVVRLSGVLAGDIWNYFATHGHRIWSKLDQAGLIDENNPPLDIDHPLLAGPVCVATMNERLADAEPSKLGANVMLQGYYKRFLKSAEHENLITFGAPNGLLGNILIRNGSQWSIYQLPD